MTSEVPSHPPSVVCRAPAPSQYTETVPKKPWPVLVGEYTSLAFLLPVSAVLGYAIGYLLDGYFGTTFLKIVFLLVGIAAGLLQLIRQLQRDTKDDPE